MELWHYIDLIIKRKLIFSLTFGLIIIASVLIAFLTPPVYQAASKIIVSSNLEQSEAINSAADKDLTMQNSDLKKQIALIRDSAVVTEVIKDLDLRDKNGVLLSAPNLLEKIKVLPLADTDIIQIRAESNSAQEAANIANSLARQFAKWSGQIRKAEINSFKKYLENRLDTIRKYQIVLSKKSAKGGKEAAALGDDLQRRLQKHIDIEIEAEKNNMLLNRKRSFLISEASDSDLESLKKERQMLAGLLARYNAETNKLPEKQRRIYVISKDSKVANVCYAMLFQKLNELKVYEAIKSGNDRIVSLAQIPQQPVRPKRLYDVLVGIVLGFLFAGCVVFVLEYIDQNVKTKDF